VTYLDCLVPNNVVSLYTPPGMLCPAYATALGKVLLAHLSLPDLEARLPRMKMESLTPHTITSASMLKAALEEVRGQGYAVDRGELHSDVHCIAVPVKEPNGEAIAAISVTARVADLPAQWEKRTVTALLACTEEASCHLFSAASLS
jgi:IclR family pca regulon transcriptional regulator